jgi:spore coat polysaccharide biosynthesis protein SpsF
MAVMKNTIAVLQARTSSTRLPGKVLMEVNGRPMIYWQAKRILNAKSIAKLIIATSNDPSDDELAKYLQGEGFLVYRGSLDNVFSRFLEVSVMYQHDALIRLTADCPLVMSALIDTMVNKFYELDVDYLSNTLEPTYPDGLDIEIMKPSALGKLCKFDLSLAEKEHVTLGIYSRPTVFKIENFRGEEDMSQNRWTVDYSDDLIFVRQIFNEFQGKEPFFTLEDMMVLMEKYPDLKSSTAAHSRNEKFGL